MIQRDNILEPQVTNAPTMKHVARAVGVALKAVSRHVNGETNINPAMSARIAAAIAQLGCWRNHAATSLRPGHFGKTIGLIISDLANPYVSTRARATEALAAEDGYLLASSSSDEDGGRHDRLVGQRVDGLTVVPAKSPGRGWAEVAPPIPPLVVDRPVDFDGADTILADNESGGYEATRALLAESARPIAFLGDSLDSYTMRARHRGDQRALQEVDVDEGAALSSTHRFEDAEESAAKLLMRDSVDAIFAANNRRGSIGALRAFGTSGRRIPLVGFGDFEAAMVTTPGVSVVTQDIAAMGRVAAEITIARANGDSSERGIRMLGTTLIPHGSKRP